MIFIITNSCQVKNLCENYQSDNKTFRSSALANSSKSNLAEERAILIAKQKIAESVDNYIKEKYELQTFIADTIYEKRILTARKTVMNNINIICSYRTFRKKMHYAHVAIELSKNDIDEYVNRIIKPKIDTE